MALATKGMTPGTSKHHLLPYASLILRPCNVNMDMCGRVLMPFTGKERLEEEAFFMFLCPVQLPQEPLLHVCVSLH